MISFSVAVRLAQGQIRISLFGSAAHSSCRSPRHCGPLLCLFFAAESSCYLDDVQRIYVTKRFLKALCFRKVFSVVVHSNKYKTIQIWKCLTGHHLYNCWSEINVYSYFPLTIIFIIVTVIITFHWKKLVDSRDRHDIAALKSNQAVVSVHVTYA